MHTSTASHFTFARWLCLCLLLPVLLILSGCGNSPEPLAVDTTIVNSLVPYASQESGVTVYHPSGWAIREEQNELAFPTFHIAPTEEALEAMNIPESGAILSFSLLTSSIMGITESPTNTVASLLELQNRAMAEIPGATLTEPTRTFRLGEWEMARQVYRIEGMGDPYVSIQSLLKRGDTYISASAFAYESQAAAARPTIDAILSKITPATTTTP